MRIFLVASIMGLATSASYAGPVAPAPQAHEPTFSIVRVADGCGPGFHVNPRGICRPNGERVVVVERPVVVVRRPPLVEEVVVRRPVVPTCGVRVGPIAVRGVC